MKLDKLKEKEGLISISLFWVSVALGILILVKLGGFFVTSASAVRLVDDALAQSKPDPNDAKKYLARFKEVADELKKKNMFAPPPPKPACPVSRVQILGDTVLVNGKWYKVGDDVGGAKILEIAPTYVKVEWEGKENVFSPFDVKDTSSEKVDSKKDEQAKKEAERERGERRPRRKGRRFRNMSREERIRLRERMRNMPPEERGEFIRKMREESNEG